nr:uncharacterized protein LOC128697273 [Cherax quadricarinatus]
MMADHIDQLYQGDNLVHVGYKNITRVSFQLPKMRCDDQLDVIKNGERLNVDAVRTEKAQCDSSKLNTVMSVSDRPVAKPDVLLTESDRRELPDLILPTAPIYSFDEDGEILQRVNTITPSNSEDCGYHSEPSEALYDDTLPCNISDHVSPPLTSTPNKDLRLDVDSWPRIDQSYVVREASETSVTLPSLHPLISEEELQSLPNIDDTPSESFHLNQPGSVPQDDTEVNIKSIPNITIFSEAGRIDTTEAIPKIDFHAASIEMVDDYLEDNFDEHQLSDLCSTVLGETG